MGNFGPEVLDTWAAGLPPGPEQPGRLRGRRSSVVRAGKVPGWGGESVFLLWRRFQDILTTELTVEFNPRLQGPYGLAMIGAWLRDRCQVDPDACEVVRCDVCHDLRGEDRTRFRLDPGRHRLCQDVRAGGLHGEWAGYGSKRKVRLYDKQAERVDAGESDPGQWLRFELEAYGPFSRVDRPGAEPEPLRLRDLHVLAWPVCEGWGVREFAYVPDDFGDPRYGMFVAGAMAFGTRFAEAQARLLLGWRGRDQLRSCYWPAVEPSPAAAFDREWPSVVQRLRLGLCA